MKLNPVATVAVALALSAFGAAGSAAAEEAYTPPTLSCEAGTIPGWLNEQGDPTSCVSDNPCPEVELGQPCPGDTGMSWHTTAPVAPEVVPEVVPAPVVAAPVEQVVAPEVAATPSEPITTEEVAAVPTLAETGFDGRLLALALVSGLGGIGLLMFDVLRSRRRAAAMRGNF